MPEHGQDGHGTLPAALPQCERRTVASISDRRFGGQKPSLQRSVYFANILDLALPTNASKRRNVTATVRNHTRKQSNPYVRNNTAVYININDLMRYFQWAIGELIKAN